MSKHWKPTDKELAKIELMATSGQYSYGDMSAELGVEVSRISYICKKNKWDGNILFTHSYSEDIINNLLNQLYPDFTIKSQFHIGNQLRLDFFIYEYNIGIEYDGVQHHKNIEFFNSKGNSVGQNKARDYHKEILCEQLGITLIRFDENDEINANNLYQITEETEKGSSSDKLEIAKQFGGVVSSTTKEIEDKQKQIKEYQKQKRQEYLASDKYKKYLEKMKKHRSQLYQQRKELKKKYDSKS